MTRPSTRRPRKCRHKNVTGRGWAYQRWYVEAASTKHCPAASALVCQDCGEWLSLGPARDTPEVMVDVRAAEIAANRGSPFGCDRFDYCPETKSETLCSLCEAHFLAHEINRCIGETT